MKTKIANTLALITAILCCVFMLSNVTFAQEKDPPKVVIPVPDEKDELPTKKDYERTLKHYAEWKDKFNDEDHWKKVVLTRISDKKQFKVKDLEPFDKQGFYLNNLRRCTFEMARLEGFWQAEIKEYTKKPPTQKDVPTVEEIKGYIEKLTVIRKEAAVKLEDYAGKFVKQFPDKLTKEEGEQLLKSIKDFNDENKLIERKK